MSTKAYPTEKLSKMMGVGPETAYKIFDPLQLADADLLQYYRRAEIKHGRVAMAAMVGWCFAANGITFRGDLLLSSSQGLTFADALKATPWDTWLAVPEFGKLQILLAAGIIEYFDVNARVEAGDVAADYGVVPVPFGWDPLNFMERFKKQAKSNPNGKTTAELRARSREAELKNGRLAMIAMAGFFSNAYITGSVPLLK